MPDPLLVNRNGAILRRDRLGGFLTMYHRVAACVLFVIYHPKKEKPRISARFFLWLPEQDGSRTYGRIVIPARPGRGPHGRKLIFFDLEHMRTELVTVPAGAA